MRDFLPPLSTIKYLYCIRDLIIFQYGAPLPDMGILGERGGYRQLVISGLATCQLPHFRFRRASCIIYQPGEKGAVKDWQKNDSFKNVPSEELKANLLNGWEGNFCPLIYKWWRSDFKVLFSNKEENSCFDFIYILQMYCYNLKTKQTIKIFKIFQITKK